MTDIRIQFEDAVMEEVPNIPQYLDNLATVAETNWKELARQNLNTSRKDYINAIVKRPMILTGDKTSITVELTAGETPGSWLPNMLEEGHAPFDMKEAILKGEESKIIFFRKGTPNAVNLNRMTSEQHAVMRSLKTTSDTAKFPAFLTRGSPQSTRSPVQAYGVHYTKSRSTSVSGAPGTPYERDDFNKMQKIVRGGSPTYGTFRTISRKSDPGSWLHPGLPALKLAEKVMDMMGLT